MNTPVRTFEDKPAVREQTPLLMGLVGASGSGKTFSALRLATGIQRVTGGDIYGIDTEARRMLHYSDRFKFRHVEFKAPFGPLDYAGAIEHCVKKGAKIIVVDSQSHEHEGPGGVLEMHEAEMVRLAAAWKTSESKTTMAAWSKPKAERRRFINTVLQMPCSFIFCFRAKEKIKIVKGKDPEQLGWMPIAGEEFVYEMALNCMLLPGSNGYPNWQSEYPGERSMMKLPEQFIHLFQDPNGTQLSEDIGEKLARWASGSKPSETPSFNITPLLARYTACPSRAEFDDLERTRKAVWDDINAADKKRLKQASDDAAKRLPERTEQKPVEQPPGEHLFGVDDPDMDAMKR
jgi:energy-coupling factor transporter ATP-binding protein EcfA2